MSHNNNIVLIAIMDEDYLFDGSILNNLTDKEIHWGLSVGNYNDSDEENNNYSRLISAGELINQYYLWVIFIIGFPGNLATVVTISRMRRLGPFVLYVALLAIGDNLALFVKMLMHQLLFKKVNVGTAGCRLLEFSGNFFMTYCNWILVLMAVERLIAVKFPFRIQFQTFLSSGKAGIILMVVGFIIAAAYVPILWASTIVVSHTDSSINCVKHDAELINAIHWTSVILYAVAPFIILVVCNILIAREIRLSFRLRNAFRSIGSFMMHKRGCDVPIQRQIMFMLFATTFMFVILHFPISVFLVVTYYCPPVEYNQAYYIRYLCQQVAYVLCDSNHALNFYLYFFSARKFRSHFVGFFRCSKTRRKSRIAL